MREIAKTKIKICQLSEVYNVNTSKPVEISSPS
jgi:hypothetical protein